MPKWTPLPPDKLIYQPDQMAFLDARRGRVCKKCHVSFKINEHPLCPGCGDKGLRLFNYLTIIAGRRFGKSLFGSISGSEEACVPNSIGWACAPTNPKLHRYVIPAFQKLIPNEWVKDWNAEYLDLRLKNGSLIHFQTLEDPDQGRGQGLDWLWIDEVCELTEKHWDVIRPSLGDKLGGAFFTTSPRSYDWVYSKLYKPAEDGYILTDSGEKLDVTGYWGLHARTADNPKFQTDEGKAFLEMERRTMSDLMYRQEYEADFVTFTGAIYGDHLHEYHYLRTDDAIRHLIPEWPEINPSRQILVGLDSGADHPFGAVKMVVTERGIVVVGEYLQRERSFAGHAEAIKGAFKSSNIRWAINKNEKQGMIELAQHGIYCMKAENDQVAGTERVKTWLHTNQLFFATQYAPRTVQQMQAYRWDENVSTDGQARKEKAFKVNDELPDCIRYALMSWPILPKPQEPIKIRDISHLSPSEQATIHRMRAIDRAIEGGPEPKTVSENFWE
jgi:hypothetical protein